MEKERSAAIGSIVFRVDAPGDTALGEAIASRLAALGFGIVADGSAEPKSGKTLINIKCSAGVEPFDRGNAPWKFCNWRAVAEISEANSGGVSFAAISKQGQSSALSEGSAKKKAASDAARALSLAVEEELSRDYFGKMTAKGRRYA